MLYCIVSILHDLNMLYFMIMRQDQEKEYAARSEYSEKT